MSTGARTGACSQASLSVEGRVCTARPLPASRVGAACGLAVVADSAAATRDATRWMPGRILVLTEPGLAACAADGVLVDLARWGFAAVVLLVDDDPAVPVDWPDLPIVLVSRPQDQECIRRAVRVSVEVVDTPARVAVPHPRHQRRRLSAWHERGGSTRVPGTIGAHHR